MRRAITNPSSRELAEMKVLFVRRAILLDCPRFDPKKSKHVVCNILDWLLRAKLQNGSTTGDLTWTTVEPSVWNCTDRISDYKDSQCPRDCYLSILSMTLKLDSDT